MRIAEKLVILISIIGVITSIGALYFRFSELALSLTDKVFIFSQILLCSSFVAFIVFVWMRNKIERIFANLLSSLEKNVC